MNALITPTSNIELSDIMNHSARLSKLLKEEFSPYLQQLMPQVITAASFDTRAVQHPEQEDHSDSYQNLLSAFEFIAEMAKQIQAGFAPYVEHVLEILLRRMDIREENSVKMYASDCLPALLCAVKELDMEKMVFERVFTALM
uniref:Importin-5 n=2 Tax=Bursaphelenchus xylophilus TaxID=6326 RepID=A0A1I7SNI5_BURXY